MLPFASRIMYDWNYSLDSPFECPDKWWRLETGLYQSMHIFHLVEHLHGIEWLTPPSTAAIQCSQSPLSSWFCVSNIVFAHLFPTSFLVSKMNLDFHPFDVLCPVLCSQTNREREREKKQQQKQFYFQYYAQFARHWRVGGYLCVFFLNFFLWRGFVYFASLHSLVPCHSLDICCFFQLPSANWNLVHFLLPLTWPQVRRFQRINLRFNIFFRIVFFFCCCL